MVIAEGDNVTHLGPRDVVMYLGSIQSMVGARLWAIGSLNMASPAPAERGCSYPHPCRDLSVGWGLQDPRSPMLC